MSKHLCPNFQEFCPDSRQIKTFGGFLAHTPPTPLAFNFRKFLLYDVKITYDEKWDKFRANCPISCDNLHGQACISNLDWSRFMRSQQNY